MPLGKLFGNKFAPKKTPPRRAHSLSNLSVDTEQSQGEFGVDGCNNIRINLGGQDVAFENGTWVTGKTLTALCCFLVAVLEHFIHISL